MAVRSDDITDLLTASPSGPGQPMSYRQGTIVEWNPITLQNKVSVGGTVLQDLPVLGVAEAASFRAGVVVGVTTVSSVWAIVGRFVVPNTADATDAITQLGQRSLVGTVNTGESTTSSTFTDLATVGPTVAGVLIPASGKVLVTCSAKVAPDTFDPDVVVGVMDFEVTGTSTRAPDILTALSMSEMTLGGSRTILLDTLTPGGLYTFTAKYLSQSGSTTFAKRLLIVQTL